MKERVRTLRKFFGLSQSEFARKINKTAGFISLVETGRSKMSEDTICAICSEFGVEENWLKTGQGRMFETEKDPVDKTHVGDRIREARKMLGFTQREFADGIGFSEIQISLVETGKIIPSNNMLQCISEKYGINNNWLMTGKGEMMESNPGELRVDEALIKCLDADPEMIRRLRIYYHLS